MEKLYTLTARRAPDRPNALVVRYSNRELALAAAAIIRDQGAVVTVIGPDGDCLMDANQDF